VLYVPRMNLTTVKRILLDKLRKRVKSVVQGFAAKPTYLKANRIEAKGINDKRQQIESKKENEFYLRDSPDIGQGVLLSPL